MGKKIFLTTSLSMILSSFLFAEDNLTDLVPDDIKTEQAVQTEEKPLVQNSLVLEKNSEAGKKIIKDETDYKAYLHKKGDLVRFDKKRADQLQENSCDINKLKTAVAMLIERVEKLESEGVVVSKEDVVPQVSEGTVSQIADIGSKKEDIDNVVAPEPENVMVCKKKKVFASWSPEGVKHSYIKYKGLKTFTVTTEAVQFEYPVIGANEVPSPLVKGTKFQADMWTLAGWVHVVDGGWVKGYVLNPPVYQVKTSYKKGKSDSYEWKEECVNVPVLKK